MTLENGTKVRLNVLSTYSSVREGDEGEIVSSLSFSHSVEKIDGYTAKVYSKINPKGIELFFYPEELEVIE